MKNISDVAVQSRLDFISTDAITKGDSSRNFSLQPGQQTEIAFSVLVDNSLEKDEIEVRFQSGSDLSIAKIPLKHFKSRCHPVARCSLLSYWT